MKLLTEEPSPDNVTLCRRSRPVCRTRSAVRSGQGCLGGHQVSRADPGCSVRLPLAWSPQASTADGAQSGLTAARLEPSVRTGAAEDPSGRPALNVAQRIDHLSIRGRGRRSGERPAARGSKGRQSPRPPGPLPRGRRPRHAPEPRHRGMTGAVASWVMRLIWAPGRPGSARVRSSRGPLPAAVPVGRRRNPWPPPARYC